MPLETETDVEEVRRVQDEDGNVQAASNEKHQKRIAKASENYDGLKQIEVTTAGTEPEALPSHTVPEGHQVLVEYRQANASDVYVGGPETQLSALVQVGDGRTYRIRDTAEIYVRTPSAGDGVIVTVGVIE